MRRLPQVPVDRLGQTEGRYLVELVRQLEIELQARPRRQSDGALYIGEDSPLRVISPNGTVYAIAVSNAGALEITEVTL